MQEWYLGWEKVSCLERCPQFRRVLIIHDFSQVCNNPQFVQGAFVYEGQMIDRPLLLQAQNIVSLHGNLLRINNIT